jgi:hypothetical protein
MKNDRPVKIARDKSPVKEKRRLSKKEMVRQYDQKIGRQSKKEQATGLEWKFEKEE